MPYMLPTQISDAFQRRGWARRAGGDLYFDGRGGSDHPHLHLRLDTGSQVVPVGKDIRLAVRMLAWSDGNQGRGGGGRNFIQNGDPVLRVWQTYMVSLGMPASMGEEFAYIMSYFTQG
jgi:hypothetical protein